MIHSILRDKSTKLFILLAGFFIVNALTAEMIGVKIFSLEDTLGVQRANIKLFGSLFSFHLTAGVLLWPVVFVMTDIINEYYGPRGVKFLSYLTVGLIGIEGRDHPVAPAVHIAVWVDMVAVCVGVACQVQPAQCHPLTIGGACQQSVCHALVGTRRTVFEKSFDIRGCWWQAR